MGTTGRQAATAGLELSVPLLRVQFIMNLFACFARRHMSRMHQAELTLWVTVGASTGTSLRRRSVWNTESHVLHRARSPSGLVVSL